MESRKIGRPSKGPRDVIKARLPKPVLLAARVQAARAGLTLNDYVGELIARDTGVPYGTQEAIALTP